MRVHERPVSLREHQQISEVHAAVIRAVDVALCECPAGLAVVLGEREQVVDEGWFGVVGPAVVPRIGDVVVAMTGSMAVVDARIMRPELMGLLGVHGSVTEQETAIPLLTWPARKS